jgi:transcriptional regulator with PAS, ATPase and Fis domain
MEESTIYFEKLRNLRSRLEYLNHLYSVGDSKTLLKFFVEMLPRVMDAERCSIFICKPEEKKICLMLGTELKEELNFALESDSVVGRSIATGKWIVENGLEYRHGFHKEADQKTGFTTRSILCVPIYSLTGQGKMGAIEILNKRGGVHFDKEDRILLEKVANHISRALENIIIDQEIMQLSRQMEDELGRFMGAYTDRISFVAESSAMIDILSQVRRLSDTPVNILLQGESGTGKELIARMIHHNTYGHNKPFVAVNCAAIPENLMESEFFGYEKGAFTGAQTRKKGKFEEAHCGTLFLDEIADMPASIQPKFLRAIETGEGCRLGSNEVIQYQFRIISATNKDMYREVKEKRFREDLYFRLFAVEIFIPPLRKRREDIIPLALTFFNKTTSRFNKKANSFSTEILNLFQNYDWPGNVRQLSREIERLIALTPEGKDIELSQCSRELLQHGTMKTEETCDDSTLPQQVKKLEIKLITQALQKSHGNKLRASKILGITRQGLDKKIKRYEINNNGKRSK